MVYYCFTPHYSAYPFAWRISCFKIIEFPGRCGIIWPHSFPSESWLLATVFLWLWIQVSRPIGDSRWTGHCTYSAWKNKEHPISPNDILTHSCVNSNEKDRFTWWIMVITLRYCHPKMGLDNGPSTSFHTTMTLLANQIPRFLIMSMFTIEIEMAVFIGI